MAVMDIWETLEIEPTNNIKEIKKAYARKLKVTRPDEHHEKFQNLHIAYKTAIEKSNQQWSEAVNFYKTQDHSSYNEDTYQEISNQEISNQDCNLHEDENFSITLTYNHSNNSREDYYQSEINRLLKISQDLLNTDTKFNGIEAWNFFINSPYILDTNFNWRLGIATLQLLDEHNKGNCNSQIKPELINYLNGIFNWSDNRDYINSLLDSDFVYDLLDKISDAYVTNKLGGLRGSSSIRFEEPSINQFSVIPHATMSRRFFAFSIDALILISLFLLIDLTPLFDMRSIHVGYFNAFILLISAAYFFLFEISNFRASLGKMVLGLVVTNEFYEPISIIKTLFRTGLTLSAVSILVSLVIYANSGAHLGLSLGLCILAFRTILFICRNSEEKILISDAWSKSFVFDLRKARLEHANR
jgi:uncharacterized RDD family membrane protein YckC